MARPKPEITEKTLLDEFERKAREEKSISKLSKSQGKENNRLTRGSSR